MKEPTRPVRALLYSLFSILFYIALSPLNGAETMDVSLMEKTDSMRREVEAKIKNEILDPIMGAGKSFVFADVEMEIIARKAEQTKEGLGVLQKYKEKPGEGSTTSTDFLLPGASSAQCSRPVQTFPFCTLRRTKYRCSRAMGMLAQYQLPPSEPRLYR